MLKRNNFQNVVQKKNESEVNLRSFATLNNQQLLDHFKVSMNGLSQIQAETILENDGKNIIRTAKEETIIHRLFEAFVNPFNVVLFIVAIITFITDVFISVSADYTTSIIILSLIFISSTISFVQQENSNKAAAKLSSMISNKADVWRDGVLIEEKIEDLVVGDIIKLSAGDMIPGDVRFLNVKDGFIAQSALTGESAPVEKFSHAITENKSITDYENIGFMGTNMVSGSAVAIILATGNDTYFGSMAKSLSGDKAKNSFEKGVESISNLLIRFMLIMVPIIFFVNGLTKHDWASALLFAVTMAVGLTPEMLPMIMTSTLAKGAVSMSKHKVIVKSLSSIQTFGEMDILCTDKTGTLTEDKIILEKYMNVLGQDDMKILRHGYLNSYFQTGLKNLIDLAIINRANENGLQSLLENYTRVDEIPFDFSRRRMSVVLVDTHGKRQLITKGAVEEVLAICKYAQIGSEVIEITPDLLKEIMEVYEKHNHDGLRMIAVAQKNNVSGVETFSVQDESEMVLIGFIGFLDPPKESAKIAINALKDHGVRTVVLTGDSEGVAIKVCGKVGVNNEICITGSQLEKMNDVEVQEIIKKCDLFSKLSPNQKLRLVDAFQKAGHTVGYMGDGINDAPALRQADVGISVDSGVDIAKETAELILLEKDLMVLEEGVILGRQTFGNIIKYIKMAASGNFGNMISVMVASIFLPFLPLLPVHILTQNLLCDFSQIGIPFDHVDTEYLLTPHQWDAKGVQRFMMLLGPLSSLFDVLCFVVLWFIIGVNTQELAPIFQTGWFVFGTISQILIVFMIRTRKIPFIQSIPSIPLMISSFVIIAATLIIAFTDLAYGLDLVMLPKAYIPWLMLLLVGYAIVVQAFKQVYIHKFKEWL